MGEEESGSSGSVCLSPPVFIKIPQMCCSVVFGRDGCFSYSPLYRLVYIHWLVVGVKGGFGVVGRKACGLCVFGFGFGVFGESETSWWLERSEYI